MLTGSAHPEGVAMSFAAPIIAALVTVAAANVSLAQSAATPPAESRATCPPDVKGEPPTVGGGVLSR